ncbi:MAG: UDP-3-O-(3-hydroxymyristoyl)glucosamine N-acyltransferase [Prevotella sp.]|uniref:UDP-3-O-(3-hydroxymyristoyl)glucosamine N-acyltransferase n=1 Tax=Prevotella sp. TaxID=59823 RepID=UPI002A25A8EE|nr:UDP-3-O-(3-hydroxymyristoyl)glucosamine N-acyltransferase [Prevotella sp.]MDD7318098.1 UDP-3-O-(3-hydroxymyristoyl)glucosamine N-acyltransferase [Prevotellaceae bacterium]MDY4021013.1 UDP-3-O-(3-hydroxymyristoyl)glucosamine N-acyltransferase [Prevotella sp.]
MEFTAKQIAGFIQGEIEGDENVKINSFAKIEEGKKGAISFLSNPKYTHFIYDTDSSIVLVNKDLVLEKPIKATLIRVDNAYECVAKLLQIYQQMQPGRKGIDPKASVAESAKIGERCYVGPFAVIEEGVEIGDNTQIYPNTVICRGTKIGCDCVIYPNVTVYHDCRLGNRVTIHSGSVIGADGFGFAPNENGYDKIPQIGIVTIEDDVEIGANTCVDRSTMGSTVVGKGVKLDNFVQVAHNVEIGENTVVSAQVGFAGSTKVGKWCMFGGQAGIAGHISVADKTFVGAQCGIISNTKGNGENLIGSPATDPKEFFRSYAVYKKLPQMYKEIAQLKQELEQMKEEQKRNAITVNEN